jgi:putative PIN family toxin of toxin-antitoxin system
VKRVVADTNVLVSAIQFGGKPKELLNLAADGHIDLAISEPIVEETLRVLRDKFHRTPDELGETGKQLRVLARTVAPTETINAVEADPSDDRILECAVAADAEVILSGDTHLLTLASFRGIPIQRVGEFLAAFQEGRRARHP